MTPLTERPRPAPDCRYCSGRGWVVGGDEPRDCYCRGLLPTDPTADNSALRGRRDALRPHPASEQPQIIEGYRDADGTWQYREIDPMELCILCDYPIGAHDPDCPDETAVREWWGR